MFCPTNLGRETWVHLFLSHFGEVPCHLLRPLQVAHPDVVPANAEARIRGIGSGRGSGGLVAAVGPALPFSG